jgi:hypothetical protein
VNTALACSELDPASGHCAEAPEAAPPVLSGGAERGYGVGAAGEFAAPCQQVQATGGAEGASHGALTHSKGRGGQDRPQRSNLVEQPARLRLEAPALLGQWKPAYNNRLMLVEPAAADVEAREMIEERGVLHTIRATLGFAASLEFLWASLA